MKENNYRDIIAKILIDIESVRFSFENPFTLTSGQKSPVYVDCRKIISFVKERNIILDYAKEYFDENNLEFDLLAGGETAGIPYAAFLSERLQKKMVYVRKKPKGFGKNKQIEGHYENGQKAILIEDLATDGKTKVIFVETLRKSGLEISDIFVIFYYDIFDFNKTLLSSMNIKMHSLCTWKNIINIISSEKLFIEKEINNLKIFLDNPEAWRKNNA